MLSPKGLHGLLDACCAKASEGTPLLDVFLGITTGIYEPALSGEGLYDIESTSNAGQSVTQAIDSKAPGKADIAESVTFLAKLGADCVYVNPAIIGDPSALCACIKAKLPFRDISSVRKFYHAIPPHL